MAWVREPCVGFDFAAPGNRTAMVGELILLPVRVGVRVTRLWFRAVEETVSMTSTATGRVVELLASRGRDGAGSETLPREDAAAQSGPSPSEGELRAPGDGRTQAPARPSRPPRRDLQPPPALDVVPRSEPVHVSEEPELVEEFAEPGAEQGAGAEVHVDPPWEGYERMNVKQVIARLATADPAELAAVQLYEGSTRRRRTILNAVERELRNPNGSGSRANE
jgi:hypothetical protein